MRLAIVFVVLAAALPVAAQDSPRQIWDSGFRQKRPAAPKTGDTTAEPAVDYRLETKPTVAAGSSGRVIGFTVWRLRNVSRGDTEAPRLLIQEPGQASSEYVPERVAVSEPLLVGDRVRLGIEVAERGYLYVVDREQYSDGTLGPPMLIFPALNLRAGDNRVEPGRLIEIPGQGDPAPALRVSRSNDRHVGEELTILVTAQPVPSVRAGKPEQELPAALVADWERRWSSRTDRWDLVGTASRSVWTASEKAAQLSERLLTQADPLPGSLYRTDAAADGTLIRVSLTVR